MDRFCSVPDYTHHSSSISNQLTNSLAYSPCFTISYKWACIFKKVYKNGRRNKTFTERLLFHLLSLGLKIGGGPTLLHLKGVSCPRIQGAFGRSAMCSGPESHSACHSLHTLHCVWVLTTLGRTWRFTPSHGGQLKPYSWPSWESWVRWRCCSGFLPHTGSCPVRPSRHFSCRWGLSF